MCIAATFFNAHCTMNPPNFLPLLHWRRGLGRGGGFQGSVARFMERQVQSPRLSMSIQRPSAWSTGAAEGLQLNKR